MADLFNATQVYVVDDDASVRVSLCALLLAHGFEAIACSRAEDFVERFDPQGALCAFVDLRMPGMDGIELQRFLKTRDIAVPVVILTAHGDVPLAVESMKAGALDFIEKPASEEQILAAISEAANLSNRPRADIPQGIVSQRMARLTKREKEVLNHLVLGMTNKHIAEQFGISQRTVEIHRARIREKMEARGLADLIRMAK